MVKSFSLTMSIRVGAGPAEQHEVRGEIGEPDWEACLDFARYSLEVRNTRFQGNPLHSAIRMEWKEGQGGRVLARLPTAEDTCLLLHKLRRLILVGERTSFPRVRKILARGLPSPPLRSWLRRQNHLFRGDRIRSVVVVRSNDAIVNSEEALQLWLNGFQYHGDVDKQKAFDELCGMLPREVTTAYLIQLLREKVVAIGNLTSLIGLLEKPGARLELNGFSGRS